MRWKRTLVVWILGIFVIPVTFFWALFGNFNLENLTDGVRYVYELDDLRLLQGLIQKEGTLYAETDDAFFWLKLPRRGKIQCVTLNLSNVNVSEKAQVYYSVDKEMDSGAYLEKNLSNGENVLFNNTNSYVKWMRFDLTNKAGDYFQLQNVIITMSNDSKIEYFVFCPLFLILYLGLTFIVINKKYLRNQIAKNYKYNERLELCEQVFSLALNDFKGRFSGSYLGVFWGVIQPLSTILLFWFVFQVGFRSNPVDNVPFILWLAAGMIPWNYFYDAWFGGTAAFTSYNYIVKKVVFKIEILPLVKILSSSILNLMFNGILIVIYCLYGWFMGLHVFDMIYYSFCVFALSLGLSYITATLNVFIKDVGQFMGIVLQILMWATPLMWSYEMIPNMPYALIYKLNPLFYILNGYRESLIYGNWFFTHWVLMVWFWFVTIILLIIGRKLMNKMKDQFVDVL